MADKDVTTKLILQGDAGGMVSAMQIAQRELGGLVGAVQGAETQLLSLSTATAAAAAAFVGFKATQYISDATMLAARVETLGVVMKVVGNNAGYTGAQMAGFAASVAAMGITTEASREAVVKMASSHMDLNKASGLARIAQDAAVIGNINSSEAFDKMIHGITAGQVEVLRTIGINVQFEASYKKLADQLGKSKDSLTENEKILARTNVVLEKGPDIAGAYAASMDTAGKIINSMKRPAEETALSIGQIFTPALNDAAKDAYKVLTDISTTLKDSKDEIQAVGWWFKYAYFIAKTGVLELVNTFYVAEIAANKLGGAVASALYLLQGGSLNSKNPFSGMMQWFDTNIKGIQDKVNGVNASITKSWKSLSDFKEAPPDKLGKQSGNDPNDKKPKDETSAWQAADDKYLAYLKSREAGIVAVAKAARDQENFDNEQAYKNNLKSLTDYLDKKQSILQTELNAEVTASENNKKIAEADLKGKTRAGGYNAKEANEYHEALKKVEEATTALTNAESKRGMQLAINAAASDAAILAEENRLAKLAEKRREAEGYDLNKTRDFLALRAAANGDSLQGELNQLEKERQGWLDNWAYKVGSEAEYRQRLLDVNNYFDQQTETARIASEMKIARTKLQINQNYLSGFAALASAANTIAGGNNKALYALTQAAAIATTFLSTEAAAAAAMAPPPIGLGPVAGAGLAASIKFSGYASMAAMAATTIANAAGIGQGSSTGGGGGGGASGTVVTQPVSPTAAPAGPTINWAPTFNGPVDRESLTRWTEEYMLPTLRDLQTRGVTA